MIYRFAISTPPKTWESIKQKTVLKISSGIIHQLDIVFPPGPSGLLHVGINRGLNQVWPTNPEANFASDHESIIFKEFYDFTQEPLEFEVFTWNEDDTYPHTVVIRLGILKQSDIQGVWLPWSEETIEPREEVIRVVPVLPTAEEIRALRDAEAAAKEAEEKAVKAKAAEEKAREEKEAAAAEAEAAAKEALAREAAAIEAEAAAKEAEEKAIKAQAALEAERAAAAAAAIEAEAAAKAAEEKAAAEAEAAAIEAAEKAERERIEKEKGKTIVWDGTGTRIPPGTWVRTAGGRPGGILPHLSPHVRTAWKIPFTKYKHKSITLTIDLHPSDNSGCREIGVRLRVGSKTSPFVVEGCHNHWATRSLTFNIEDLPDEIYDIMIEYVGYWTGDEGGFTSIRNPKIIIHGAS